MHVNIPVGSNQSTPVYEYHIKTVAIIEGSPESVHTNELENSDDDRPSIPSRQWETDYITNHRLLKRDTTYANESAANSTEQKEVVKRHSYHSGPPRPYPGRGMTQAIMKPGNPRFRAQAATYPEETNIEGFFRKNVPIYDGIPAQKVRVHSSFTRFPSAYRPFVGRDEDEEEEGNVGNPMVVEEVDPEHDSQYEHVPMTVDELGKQKVMENYEEEGDSKPRFPFTRYQQHDQFINTPFPSTFNKVPSFSSHISHSPFRSHEPTQNSFSHPPPKYGTSHQYNSLADERPRYYKHFAPSIRSQQRPSSLDDDRPFSHPTSNRFDDRPYSHPTPNRFDDRPYSHPTPNRFAEHSPTSYHHDFDFAASRDNAEEGLFRTGRVPQTLEEYHRIHSTFEKPRSGRGFNPRFRGRPHKRVIVPQDDAGEEEEEDEKEEKDDKDEKEETDDKEESPGGSKSFVSMNFKNFGFDNDDGVSIRHQLAPSKSRFSSYKTPIRDSSYRSPLSDSSYHSPLSGSYRSPLSDKSYKSGRIRGSSFRSKPFGESSDESGEKSFRSRSFGESPRRPEHLTESEDVEYPPLPLESSESMHDTKKFKENSEAVKSFVDSIFNKNKAIEQASNNQNQIQTRPSSSQFNPNFGERVKMTPKPAQNKLWHRSPKAEQDFHREFQKLKVDFTQPAKRDALEKENGTAVASESATEIVPEVPESSLEEEVEDNEPEKSENEPVEENHDDDQSHERFWSESYSEPTK